MTVCDVKGVVSSDNPTLNYDPTLKFPTAESLLVLFCLLFPACDFIVLGSLSFQRSVKKAELDPPQVKQQTTLTTSEHREAPEAREMPRYFYGKSFF